MLESKAHYRSIFKATSLIGGSAFINILIGMIRTKFVAVLLGPSGVGLIGIYGTITNMVAIFSGMGINNSGTRQIAEAYGTHDQERIARTVIALRRVCWLTGFTGFLIMVAGSRIWSKYSFGNYDHAFAIALLGSTVLMVLISNGQSCILQGSRRLSDLAKASIIGSINGTLICIPCFYFFGMKGIVPSMILCSFAAVATSWWFARKVPVIPIAVSLSESKVEVFKLINFGFPIMLSALGGALTAYLIRIILIRQIGFDGVGLYQSAFSVSGILVSFVLSAMGTDYYPRLTSVAYDNIQVAREVNAQTEIALLLAVPALAITIIFAPIVIAIFYSGQFDGAVPVLRWSVYGMLERVVSWPLGFVILAKGKSKIYLCVEILSNLFHIIAVWLCTKICGLSGTGIAFCLFYLVNTVLMILVIQKISRVHWTRTNLQYIGLFFLILALLGLNCALTSILWLKWTLSLFTFAVLGLYSLHRLSNQTGITFQSVINKFKRQ